ncbi:cytochrome c oxidase assembly factor 1 family protein [Blastopirellula sp. JC732]|uniref:Cytochrome c oxidase assembly factor 1 family protein n=1 Tax=Blastopirellula sediminis TaxID=2894196 RepID=A0A9X1MRX5_9BACT|nr:cytochrome c oxidase assembly factor Coa1 family protein [Blastopirellula sediminis]MCC9604428.1 cytochrome c oxidase assembly factor 1 family protein [Blastopirellula sediminis]MCC9632273.1 cytochrome c oxidase assembly factor 1 family protein [Blastopirellula sediminis]
MRKRRGGALKIVLLSFVITFLIGSLLCTGIGYLYFNTPTSNYLERNVKAAYGHSPAMVEHIGEWQSSSINFTHNGELAAEFGRATFCMDVVGSKGTGRLYIMGPIDIDQEGYFTQAFLKVGDETYELGPGRPK